MLRLMTVLMISAMVFFGMVSGANALPPSYEAHFNGHGVCSGNNVDARIGADRASDGTVYGQVAFPGGLGGTVVEVVPPSVNIYWCINILLDDGSGSNIILFIDDSSNVETLSLASGTPITCAGSSPAAQFAPVDSGVFVGQVVPDTCASDLATANAALGQCESDLSNFVLPLLPAHYDAKFTLKGTDALLTATLKVSAKRKMDDTFSGNITLVNQFKAKVNQLNAVQDGNPNWCTSGTIVSAVNPNLVGQNVVVFAHNKGKGCDPSSYAVDVGIDCSTNPSTLALKPITGGTFQGKVLCDAGLCCPEL